VPSASKKPINQALSFVNSIGCITLTSNILQILKYCVNLTEFLIFPFTALTKFIIPSLLRNLYLIAFTPDLFCTLPPNLFCIWHNIFSSSIPVVISQFVYLPSVTPKQPSPSIKPANHSLNFLSFKFWLGSGFDDSRIISLVFKLLFEESNEESKSLVENKIFCVRIVSEVPTFNQLKLLINLVTC